MENQNVEQVLKEEVVQEGIKQFPSAEMLETMGITQEEFDKKFEEIKNIPLNERIEHLEQLMKNQEELKEENSKLLKELERTNLITSLNKEGLDVFQGLFDLTTNEERVEFLKNAVNQILVKHSYQPKDVAKQEQYTQAMEQGDVQKALGFKFSKLFGK